MRSLPNLLTLARLLSAPWIAWLIVSGRAQAGFYWLIAAGVTDALDGWLARRLAAVSRLGAYLDPVADKILAACVFVSLGMAGALPWWLVALVFGRDVLILGAAGLFLALTSVRKFPPSVWGKLSTLCQLAAAGAASAHLAFPGLDARGLLAVLIWAAAAATVWSGLHYLWRTLSGEGKR